jgi:hypothetical protein
MEKIEILPFISAGEFKLNEKRKILLPKIKLNIRSTQEEEFGINNFIIDNYDEALAYYNKSNEQLFYVLFAPLPSYELIFKKQNLFVFNSGELFKFLNNLDNKLYVEDYVGFGSLKYGIDVYAPNFTEDETSAIEGISFAIKGYFESIYSKKELNINELQREKTPEELLIEERIKRGKMLGGHILLDAY